MSVVEKSPEERQTKGFKTGGSEQDTKRLWRTIRLARGREGKGK